MSYDADGKYVPPHLKTGTDDAAQVAMLVDHAARRNDCRQRRYATGDIVLHEPSNPVGIVLGTFVSGDGWTNGNADTLVGRVTRSTTTGRDEVVVMKLRERNLAPYRDRSDAVESVSAA